MLCEHIECADTGRRSVLRVIGYGRERRGAFEHLEAIGRNQYAFRGLVQGVVGATDAWRRREAPLGAPILTTRSMSPQSTPRSRDDVATTARSLPCAIAASTLRRCATSSEP